ncbi:unnamed protein product [Owenia fusiformis]|uniref:Uncharacterized protein n=1 Tax=Owenia fusiformis TaxID=6347 RepID=A0A8J1TAW2_OWEFU|nr:unnamed protein product [Owenia fusiformis]
MATSSRLMVFTGCLFIAIILYSLSENTSKFTDDTSDTSEARKITHNRIIEDAFKLYYNMDDDKQNVGSSPVCKSHQPTDLDLDKYRMEMIDHLLEYPKLINSDQIVLNKEWCTYNKAGNIFCTDNDTSMKIIEFDIFSIIGDEIIDRKISGIANLDAFVNTLGDVQKNSLKGKDILSIVQGRSGGRIYRQFLFLTSKSIFSEAKSKHVNKGYNLNVLFLKDFSRSEFYRKCPETRKTLQTLLMKNQCAVIDFPLHHAVFLKENDALRGFLKGKTNSFSSRQTSLFDEYRRLGYKIVRIDNQDLPRTCHACDFDKFNSDEISSSLIDQLIRKSIKSLNARLNSVSIRDEVRYIEYVMGYIEALLKTSSQPLFSFSYLSNLFDELNLDGAFADTILSRHLEALTEYDNTVTIIVSNKGSTRKFLENKYHTVFETLQVSNPPLFIVVPNAIPKHIREIFASIQSNALKIVTLLDLNNVLNQIGSILSSNDSDLNEIYVPENQMNATPIKQTDEIIGMHPIFETNMTSNRHNLASYHFPFRTCDDINQLAASNGNKEVHILPCICEGKQIEFPNDTIQVALAEFAIAHINSLIHDSVKSLKIHEAKQAQYAPCAKLRGVRFMNVKSERQNDSVITRMVITAHPILKNVNETISLSITVMASLKNNSVLNTTMIYYNVLESTNKLERTDTLNPLCFSNGETHEVTTLFDEIQHRREVMAPHFGVYPKIHAVDRHGCLILLIRDYSHTVVVEAANMCSGNSEFTLTVDVELRNMRTSRVFPVTETISPRENKFLGYLQQTSYYARRKQYAFITSFTIRLIS